jgi:Flp pilus assembly protein TadG
MFRRTRQRRRQRGATTVEAALVIPVFLFFVYWLMEIAHMVAIDAIIQNGVREAARLGSTPGVTNQQAIERLQDYVGSLVSAEDLQIEIKDASGYDDGSLDISDTGSFEQMNDIQLEDATPRTLFGIRARVNVDDVAFIPWPFTDGVTLSGVMYMRHE